MTWTSDSNAYKLQIDNDISTQSLPNSIPPDVVGSGYTDLVDMLTPYINSINNESILSGTGVPSSGTGNNLDLYFRTQPSYFELYRKESGAWVLKVSVPFGITLPDGPATLRSFISGTVASVTKGGWFISNAVYNKATQTNFTVPTADATFYRTDLIYANASNQILYLSGTPSLTPADPTLPANTIAVDYVIVPSVASGFDPYLRYGSTTESNGLAEQNDTGALTYGGITVASSTTVNIGACTGYVVNNESVPGNPTIIYVNYAGETNKTVTTLGSGIATYVLLNGAGVIVFQNAFPTSAQRKTHIYLSKIGHPAGTITTAGNEVDYVLSPLAQHRDLFQAINYINEGVAPSASGATLNFALSTGKITGDGINFVADNTNPNTYTVAPQPTASFLPRTQTGAGGTFTSTVDVANYDVAGTVTAIPGGGSTSTIRYIYLVPTLGLIVQYGQTTYANLTDAIAAVGKESFTIYPSLVRNAILVGALAATKSATALNNTTQARFFLADKFGQLGGASSGISTATFQSTYNNSLQPQVLTDATRGAVQFKRGSAADTDNVMQVLNGAGTANFSVTGNGDITYLGYSDANVLQKVRVVLWGDSLTSGSSIVGANYGIQLANALGLSVSNKGVGGETSSQILTRFNADSADWVYPTIIWSGRNNFSSPTQVKADIASMVSSLGHNNYLILSILNSDTATEYIGQPNYVTITTLNNNLATLYGAHYLDVRAYLLTQGDGSGGDNTDIANGVPPRSLRNTGDPLHLNAKGYSKIAAYIVANGSTFITPTINKPLSIDSLRTLFNNAPNIGGTEMAKGYFNKFQLGSNDPKFSDTANASALLTFVTSGVTLPVYQSNAGNSLFIGGNILFPTDATYDIGQGIGTFGARNGYFSGTVNSGVFNATTAFRFGTTSSSAPLEIADSGSVVSGTVALFGKVDSTGRWEITNAGGTTSRRLLSGYTGTTKNIQLDPTGTSYFNNSNTVIGGTTSSGFKLDVLGTFRSTGIGSFTAGAEAMKVGTDTGNPDHAYIGLYARTATPTTRSGSIGYTAVASSQLSINNEISGGTILFTTTGSGSTSTFVTDNVQLTPASASSQTWSALWGVGGTNSGIKLEAASDAFTDGPSVFFSAFRGTNSSKTAMTTSSRLFTLIGQGATAAGTVYKSSAIASAATENWSLTAGGSKLEFYTTPNTTVAQSLAMTIDQDGSVKGKFKTMTVAPTTSDIAAGFFMLVKETTGGTLKLYANDGGTIKSVQLT